MSYTSRELATRAVIAGGVCFAAFSFIVAPLHDELAQLRLQRADAGVRAGSSVAAQSNKGRLAERLIRAREALDEFRADGVLGESFAEFHGIEAWAERHGVLVRHVKRGRAAPLRAAQPDQEGTPASAASVAEHECMLVGSFAGILRTLDAIERTSGAWRIRQGTMLRDSAGPGDNVSLRLTAERLTTTPQIVEPSGHTDAGE